MATGEESLTVAHQCLHEVSVRRDVIHPLPPSKFSERLQYTITVSKSVSHQQAQAKGGREDSQDQDE